MGESIAERAAQNVPVTGGEAAVEEWVTFGIVETVAFDAPGAGRAVVGRGLGRMGGAE